MGSEPTYLGGEMLGAVNTRQLRLSAGGSRARTAAKIIGGRGKNAFRDKLNRETATLAEG